MGACSHISRSELYIINSLIIVLSSSYAYILEQCEKTQDFANLSTEEVVHLIKGNES